MGRLTRVGGVLTSAVLGLGLVVALPGVASAETTAPWLDSVSRTTSAVVGADTDVGIHIAAHDTGGSHFGYWTAGFVGPSGTMFYVQSEIHESGADAVDEIRTRATSHWLESGIFRATSVLVVDGQGNTADYRRDGNVIVGGVPVRPHALDLSSLDFTVANPSSDAVAPTVSGLSVAGSTVAAGDAAVMGYTGHDTGSGIASVSATYQLAGDSTPAGMLVLSSPADPALAALGPASAAVPLAQQGGVYSLVSVSVTDLAGNLTLYGPGSVQTVPSGLTPRPVPLDLAAQTLTVVQAGVADVTAPALGSIAMTTSTVRHAGDEVLFAIRATDASTAVTGAWVFLTDTEGHVESTQMLNCDFANGVAGWWIRTTYPPGTWTVTHVQVTDQLGNFGQYFPDGTGQDSGGHPITGPVFTGLGFSVVAGSPTDETLSVPPCPDTSVSTVPSDTYATPGSTVTVAGAVSKGAARVPSPAVAVYATVGSTTRLLGISRGTAAGAFTRRVTVGASTSFRTLFLGSGRVVGATPTLSRSARVLVGARQGLSPSASAVGIRKGRTGLLAVTLSPHRSVAVTLQHKVGSVWRAVTVLRTTSRGVTSWHIPRPAATTYYRWAIGFGGGYLPASSRAILVRRA